MKRIIQCAAFALIVMIATVSCKGKKDDNAALNDKKSQLEKLKSENTKSDEQIKKLQDELALLDTASANSSRIKLVSVTPVAVQNFTHTIDLQGKVDADNISYISPRGMGGQVKAIYVHQGDVVKKGQLLLKLDDAVMRQQVAAVRQQQEGIKTQMAYAKNLANRQQNLWDQGIGTEVQLISAKTNVTGLENQLSALNEQVKLAQEQMNTANVYSDVSGVADVVTVRLGETFTGGSMLGGPQIKIVNTSSLKVTTSVPENYISRLKRGSPAEVTITDINKTYNASVSLLSQSVDPTSRGFSAEIKIPYDALLKPNQSAKVRITDYTVPNVIVIPVNVIQSDENGKYVYVIQKLSNGKAVAKKRPINLGEVYGNNAEVKTGLTAGEQLITEGYQGVYEGQGVTTEVR